MTTAAVEPGTVQPAALAALDERYERLPIEQIVPSKTNPRTHFDDQYLGELAGSIAEKGVVQPILVRQVDAGNHKPVRFEIVAGECRYRASKIAKQTHIPAVIRQYSNEQVLELQLIENIHRKDLTALEQATGYRALIKANPDKHSAASIASRIGMSEAWVWDRLKLNDLIPEAKQILEGDRMSVGHGILIARLKPEDQKRTIAFDAGMANGMYRPDGGLWRRDNGRIDFDEDDPANKGKKPGKYDDVKACSVRELETWIRNHVRFDVEHAAKAQPLTFEPVLARVSEAEAKAGRGKKLISITHEYRVADDARDDEERTYGSQSWERADGQEKSKTCDHAVLGIVVAGAGYGDTFEVCVARDKCLVHFGDVVRAKQKAAKLRDAGKGKKAAKVEKKATDDHAAKWKREEAERNARGKAWRDIEPHIIADAVAQVKPIKALTPKLAAALLEDDISLDEAILKKHLGAQWFKTPVSALLVCAVAGWHYSSYHNKRSGFDDFVRETAKPFGLDLKRLEAIRDKHQPKAAAAPAKKAS